MASSLNLIRYLFSNLGPIFPNTAATIGTNLLYSPRRFQPHRSEKEVEQTGKVSFFNSSQGKLKIYYWPGKKKENVFLVHGWEGRATQMYKFVQPLLDEGYSVLAFDGPAHGSSEGKKTTILLFVQAIEEIYKRYGAKYIIAHSFGASASAIAISNGLKVNKAVLISTPYSFENVVNGFAKFLNIPEKVSKIMHSIFESNKWHGKPRDYLSFSTLGEKLTLPLLIVHDKRDKYIPFGDGNKVHECCKTSEFIPTDGYGHNAILKNNKVINQSIDFLIT